LDGTSSIQKCLLVGRLRSPRSRSKLDPDGANTKRRRAPSHSRLAPCFHNRHTCPPQRKTRCSTTGRVPVIASRLTVRVAAFAALLVLSAPVSWAQDVPRERIDALARH